MLHAAECAYTDFTYVLLTHCFYMHFTVTAPVPIASTHVTCTRGPEPAAAAAASAAVAATHLAPSIAPEMSPPASPKQLPAVGSPFPVQLTELSATDTMPDPDPTFLNLPVRDLYVRTCENHGL